MPTRPPLEKHWIIQNIVPTHIQQTLTKYSPILQQLLFNRGIVTEQQADEYISASPIEGTEPNNLSGMLEAVQRIQVAIKNEEKIIIYGDYDVDGVTATVLLVNCITRLGGQVEGYIPNRFDEGYGVNKEALKEIKSRKTSLLITVDCGIRSWQEAEYAHDINLDMIITDHHHPLNDLPIAIAIINPKQEGDLYPYKDLSGVGIAYKLACALLEAYNKPHPTNQVRAEDFLDLVALGTVADLVPLTKENRYLVRRGLREIQKTKRIGLQALLGVAGVKQSRVTSGDIGHVIGPRLNAAGRLDSAKAAMDLLLSTEPHQAGVLAQQLNNQNRDRQQLTQLLEEKAEEIIYSDGKEPLLLFASDEEFNPGVVGLVASHLSEKFYRPAIIGHRGEEFTRASCRSIQEFHITNALDACADLMEHHGGHAAAAGFTVRNEHLPELLKKLDEIVQTQLGNLDLYPKLIADMEIDLSKPVDFFPDLVKIQPTGHENRQPSFVTRNIKPLDIKRVGEDGKHLRFKTQQHHKCIAFRFGHLGEKVDQGIDILYTMEINEYRNEESLQLNIKDIKLSA